MTTKEFKQENEKKYGRRENDIIAQIAELNKDYAVLVCLFSAAKYARRYYSNTENARQVKDQDKIYDCLSRAYDYNVGNTEVRREINFSYAWFEKLIESFNEKNVEAEFKASKKIEEYCLLAIKELNN